MLMEGIPLLGHPDQLGLQIHILLPEGFVGEVHVLVLGGGIEISSAALLAAGEDASPPSVLACAM